MVTVEANSLISSITDRMPAIVAPDDWSKWLGEEAASIEELKGLLAPIEGDWEMAAEIKPKSKPGKPDPQPTLF